MKYSKIILLLCYIILISACSADETSDSTKTNDDIVVNDNIVIKEDTISSNEIISSYKYSKIDPVVYFCEVNTNGKFNFKTLMCECPTGTSFVGHDYGKCLPTKKQVEIEIDKRLVSVKKLELKKVSPTLVDNDLKDKVSKIPFMSKGQYLKILNIDTYRPTHREFNGFLALDVANPGTPKDDILKEFHTYLSNENNSQLKLSEINGQGLEIFKSFKIKSRSNLGCLRTCEIVGKKSKGKITLEWVRHLVGGTLYKNFVHVRGTDRFIKRTYVLDFDNNYNFDINYIRVIENNNLQQTIIVNSHQNELYRYKSILVEKIDSQLELKRYVTESTNKSIGLLCDTGINLRRVFQEGLEDKIIYPRNLTSNSFSGLFDSKSDFSYYSGLNPLHDTGISYFGNESDHSYLLLEHVKYSKFIPFNFIDCLMNASSWIDNAVKRNVKVANVSAADVQGSRACEKSKIMKSMNHPKAKNILWVMSAGNNGLKKEKAKQRNCPQNVLSGRKNILIAGADRTSNNANDYLDIYVSGDHWNSIKSSSEAAILISDFALKLMNEYEELSIRDVRRAIILSASIRYNMKNSRAGGELDKDRAFEIAQLIEDEPSITNEEIVKEVFSWSDERKKLKHLRSLGGKL